MPTYEYRCPEGHTFDVFQKMSEEPGATCPECGKAAERQISAGSGFLFKGDGFYITDYRSKEYKEKAKAEESSSTSKDSGAANGSKGTSGSASSGDSSGSSGSSSSSGSSGTSGTSGSSDTSGGGSD